MIFDVRKYTLRNIARIVRQTASESGAAHVYVKGFDVLVHREMRADGDYIGNYTASASEEHVIRDICAEIGGEGRK